MFASGVVFSMKAWILSAHEVYLGLRFSHKPEYWTRPNGSAGMVVPVVVRIPASPLGSLKCDGRPALIQKDAGEMLIAIVLDRPRKDAETLVDNPAAFTQEILGRPF